MPITADVAQLKNIIPDTTITDEQLQNHLTQATTIKDAYLSDKNLDSDILNLITVYLAAHLLSVGLSPQLKEQRLGDASQIAMGGDMGIKLTATLYGQTAIFLDRTNTLNNMSTRKPVVPTFMNVEVNREKYDGSE